MSQWVIRPMRAGEQERVLDLLEHAFGIRELFARYMSRDPQLRAADTLLALTDNEPVSCVQIFSKQIRLRGRTLPLAGVGSVATHSAHRRQGLASALVHHAIAEMEERGLALALLFTDLREFYERLGFVSLTQRRHWLHPPAERPDTRSNERLRSFTACDLEAVRDLYETYSASLESTTVRDAAYWEGQLGYAGNPDEDFRVAEREGQLVAYARATRIEGTPIAIEFARAPQGVTALAELLLALTPANTPLLCPRGPDPQLEAALAQLGVRLEPVSDPTHLWRVIDRLALLQLAGRPESTPDRELLEDLLGGSRALYWPSDRF